MRDVRERVRERERAKESAHSPDTHGGFTIHASAAREAADELEVVRVPGDASGALGVSD
jgi:hypothetical protein